LQRIATCLMFVGDQYGKAEEAIELYVSAFEDARIVEIERFSADEEESGLKRARFTLAGRAFIAMDSGREHPFTFTPAMSLFVDFDSAQQFDRAFEKLSNGATILMPLQAYDFSPKFAWLNDRFGVSWQLNLVGED
jgi:predicted 3-demethylubiquinone-9 3-methyltransferase (glyoxalase superfamily)